jgi:hypothetical protein
MLKDFLGINQKKRASGAPSKENKDKIVPAARFNGMIDYYTAELKSRLDEIARLKQENEMLIKTSIKSAAHSDEYRLHAKKLAEEVRVLQQKLQDRADSE